MSQAITYHPVFSLNIPDTVATKLIRDSGFSLLRANLEKSLSPICHGGGQEMLKGHMDTDAGGSLVCGGEGGRWN